MDYRKLILSDAIKTAMEAEKKLIVFERTVAILLCIIIVLLLIILL